MKTAHFIFVLLFYKHIYAGDTLQFMKQFPKIETVVLKDTLIDIRNGLLDTFAVKPKIIFIVRNYDNSIRNGNIREIYIQDVAHPEIGYFEYVYGINYSVNFSSRPDIYKKGHQYSIKLIYSNGNTQDTIHFKTFASEENSAGKCYVYEVKIGIPSYYTDCVITLSKNIKSEQKEKIKSFLNSKDVFYFAPERQNNRIREGLITFLKLDKKKATKLNCNCNFYLGERK